MRKINNVSNQVYKSLTQNVDTNKQQTVSQQTDLKRLTFTPTALFNSSLAALANEPKSISFGVYSSFKVKMSGKWLQLDSSTAALPQRSLTSSSLSTG